MFVFPVPATGWPETKRSADVDESAPCVGGDMPGYCSLISICEFLVHLNGVNTQVSVQNWITLVHEYSRSLCRFQHEVSEILNEVSRHVYVHSHFCAVYLNQQRGGHVSTSFSAMFACLPCLPSFVTFLRSSRFLSISSSALFMWPRVWKRAWPRCGPR